MRENFRLGVLRMPGSVDFEPLPNGLEVERRVPAPLVRLSRRRDAWAHLQSLSELSKIRSQLV